MSGRLLVAVSFDPAVGYPPHIPENRDVCELRWVTLAAKKKARWSCAPPGIDRPSLICRASLVKDPIDRI